MPEPDPDFGFDVTVDRRALLEQAALLVDKQKGKLAPGGEHGPSVEGDQLRALLDDRAEWGDQVEAYRITDADYLARQMPAPVRFRELSRDYHFAWLRFPVYLEPKLNWGYNQLVARVEFNPGQAGAGTRPTAWQVLPDPKFQTLLQAHQSLDVDLVLDNNFTLNVAAPQTPAPVGTATAKVGVEALARGGAGAVVGPFVYHIVRAEIQHSGTGNPMVKWQIVGKKFFQETMPSLVVIARVPKQTEHISVRAELATYRFFNLGAAGLWQSLQTLPRSLYDFFVKKGAPRYSCRVFELVGEPAARSHLCNT